MRYLKKCFYALVGLLGFCCCAQAQVKGSAALLSEFVFRGFPQTEGQYSFQTDINFDFPDNYFLGWTATRFVIDGEDDIDSDFYFGRSFDLGENGDLSAMYLRTVFFTIPHVDQLRIGYNKDKFSCALWQGFLTPWTYLEANQWYGDATRLQLRLHAARWEVYDEFLSYDWRVGLARKWGKLTLECTYIDSSVDKIDEAGSVVHLGITRSW